MSLRAAIRANVLLARLDRPRRDKADVMQSARAYFGLAHLTIHSPAPRLIAIGGRSGTGKSRLARDLAPQVRPQPGAVLLRAEVLRKQLFLVRETDRQPENALPAETPL